MFDPIAYAANVRTETVPHCVCGCCGGPGTAGAGGGGGTIVTKQL